MAVCVCQPSWRATLCGDMQEAGQGCDCCVGRCRTDTAPAHDAVLTRTPTCKYLCTALMPCPLASRCATRIMPAISRVQVTSDAVFINDRAVANGTAVSSVFTFNLGVVAVHEVRHRDKTCSCISCSNDER